jgi:hypothetical protein
MTLAFIPISAQEAFGIMTRCRETLDGRACERTNPDHTARLWVFAATHVNRVVLAWVGGQFFVGTRALHEEVLHAA